ncbi:MAG: hypothetical protein ACK5M3_12770 [Dysgonomonas sp.]
MKQLFFCFSILFIIMACSSKPNISGRWAMEMDGNQDTAIIMFGDTIIAPELRINNDSVYMEIRKNGIVDKEEFIGVYTITGNEITVTDRYGKQKIQNIVLKDDVLIITDKDDPNKIIMRLIRIKEES